MATGRAAARHDPRKDGGRRAGGGAAGTAGARAHLDKLCLTDTLSLIRYASARERPA